MKEAAGIRLHHLIDKNPNKRYTFMSIKEDPSEI
jgi:hypothetical protein